MHSDFLLLWPVFVLNTNCKYKEINDWKRNQEEEEVAEEEKVSSRASERRGSESGLDLRGDPKNCRERAASAPSAGAEGSAFQGASTGALPASLYAPPTLGWKPMTPGTACHAIVRTRLCSCASDLTPLSESPPDACTTAKEG